MTTIPEMPADLEAAAQPVQELSAQVVEKAKENGLAWLEGYERTAGRRHHDGDGALRSLRPRGADQRP